MRPLKGFVFFSLDCELLRRCCEMAVAVAPIAVWTDPAWGRQFTSRDLWWSSFQKPDETLLRQVPVLRDDPARSQLPHSVLGNAVHRAVLLVWAPLI